jgi:hypothetical protein
MAIPAAVTLLVVVTLIGINGANRSGEPHLRLTMSERELPLAGSAPADKRGPRLYIDYVDRYDALDARNWLSEERLRAIGFVFDVMPGAPEAADTYRRLLPKIAWVAFEYDGPAWRDIARRQALKNKQEYVDRLSRLVPIDASVDRDALVSRYPTGHLVLRASIRIDYVAADQPGGPVFYGRIDSLIPPEMSVPIELRDRLATLPPRAEHRAPRYDVDVALGRLGIPYITDIRVDR